MMERIQNDRINELTEAIVLDYLNKTGQDPKQVVCIDLDGIAKEYYGLDVIYETIAEEDKDIVAFTANGIRPLKVIKNGVVKNVVFNEKTIVLDTYFKQPSNSVQRRLTLSHELGHRIYEKISNGHNEGNYRRIFDSERKYTFDEMKEQWKITESEATQAGCGLQMPLFLLKNTLKRVMRKNKFTVYGNHQLLPDDSKKLKKMADDIGVSPNMLLIQLKKHKLISFKSIEEYLKVTGLEGVC